MYAIFVILFLLSLLCLVIATIKPGTNKKTGKPYKRKDMAIGFGIIMIIFLALAGVTAPKTKTTAIVKPKTTTVAAKKSVTQSKPVATKTTATTQVTTPTTQTPTVSLATLNAESVTDLTPVITDFENQMSQGQSYASESNAGDVSSDFHTWETAEQDKENVSNGNEQVDAYNKADNAYFNAHQTAPTALSNWDTDAGDIPGDITEWANAEEMVADDTVTGSSSLSTDKQTAASDLQQYQTDLSKAQADLKQL